MSRHTIQMSATGYAVTKADITVGGGKLNDKYLAILIYELSLAAPALSMWLFFLD